MSVIEQSSLSSLQEDSLSEDKPQDSPVIHPENSHPTTPFQFIDQPSPEAPAALELPPSQPFESSLSDIDQEDTINICDASHPSLLQPRPIHHHPQQHHREIEDRLSMKDTLPVVKRRKSRPFSRGKSEHSDSEGGYGYFQRGYRRSSRGKWREDGYYSKPYRNYEHYNERERGDRASRNNYSSFPTKYDRDHDRYERDHDRYEDHNRYDRNHNRYDRDHYSQQRFQEEPRNPPVSSNPHPQQQINLQNGGYLTNPVQASWNPTLWLQYLTLRENLKYMDMYYYQNYPQLAHMLYAAPAFCPNGQLGYSPFATAQSSEAIYSPHLPAKQLQVPKKEERSFPDPFGKICLPKFQIFVNKCCISVTCCKMQRLQADLLLIPYHSPNFALFPGFTPDLYFSSRQRGQSVQSQVLKGQASNGKLSIVKTDQSRFKSLAFVKVCSPYQQNFTNCFNRGLTNLFSDASGISVVVPYSNDFGSSQEKAKRLVDILRVEERGWERVVVNCQDVASFKRMVEGFSRIVCQLDDRGDLDF